MMHLRYVYLPKAESFAVVGECAILFALCCLKAADRSSNRRRRSSHWAIQGWE